MSGESNNSAAAYTGASLDSVHESIGIPQFSGSAAEKWYLVQNGLIIQGGKISIPLGTSVYQFVTGFTQQVLGIFLQPTVGRNQYGVTPTSLIDFQVISNNTTQDVYWWAIGV